MLPPDAVSVVELPLQSDAVPPIIATGKGLRLITTSSVAVPHELLTDNVYVTDAVGVATGLAIVVLLNPAEGLQLKPPLPVALKVVLLPTQIVTSDPAPAEGNGFTLIAVPVLLLHPFPSVAVTV